MSNRKSDPTASRLRTIRKESEAEYYSADLQRLQDRLAQFSREQLAEICEQAARNRKFEAPVFGVRRSLRFYGCAGYDRHLTSALLDDLKERGIPGTAFVRAEFPLRWVVVAKW